MVVPFGFAVGDFIAGIELVHDLIKALKESEGSSAEFIELMRELYSLERALLQVKALKLELAQESLLLPLEQAASQCQETIDQFLRKNKKFQSSLREGGSKNSWRGVLCKIQWRLYKKEDVSAFRAMLSGHTSSINMLLLVLQV